MKTCKKCNNEKELSFFRIMKGMKDGYSNSCKECDVIANREYKEKNKEKVSEKKKEWREKNKELIKKQRDEYRENNKEHLDKMDKIWRENNREHLQEYGRKYSKEYRENNPDYVNNYYENNKDGVIKDYREKNKENIKETRKIYSLNNREYITKRTNEYHKNRLKNDNLYKLSCDIRGSIRNSFKNKKVKKSSKTVIILGCSFEDFKLHLESMFESWMTWDNRGLYNGELNYGWDIDHKIPLASAETEEDLIRLNHYTNLQPLCSYTNRQIKKDRLDF